MLDQKTFAAAFLRIAGLWLMIAAINNVAWSSFLFVDAVAKRQDISLAILFAITNIGIPLVFALAFVRFPYAISSRVLKIEESEPPDHFDLRPLQQVAFSAFGLWLSVHSVLDIILIVAKGRLFNSLVSIPTSIQAPITADDFAHIVRACVQLALGLWLLWGSEWVVMLFHACGTPGYPAFNDITNSALHYSGVLPHY